MKKLIVLTGAGISAESGLKTFRDYDGLWENHRIEEVATPNAWKSNPQLVLDFYNHRRKEAEKALPNAAHLGLVLLEKYYDIHIITQNVDNLHEKAGSQNILHLHGSLFSKCSDKESIAPDGGYWRPDIVWFGENVDNYEYATTWMQDAAIVVVIGTSLQVYPAAGLVTLAPYATPVYIIDPNMDKFINQFTTIIPKAATEGIKDLIITLMPNLSETVNF
jgi:NAD-dependent deacetylase